MSPKDAPSQTTAQIKNRTAKKKRTETEVAIQKKGERDHRSHSPFTLRAPHCAAAPIKSTDYLVAGILIPFAEAKLVNFVNVADAV